MPRQYELIFDRIVVRQLRKSCKDGQVRLIISKMLDKLEIVGPLAGKLLDPKIMLYEMKNISPPIRLYFKEMKGQNKLYVFEFEMKTSQLKQKKTISRLRSKSKVFPS